MNQQLEKKLQTLPREPGVYFHKSKSGEIIYVGKAAVLRVSSQAVFSKITAV
jgi:excinuclease ABC subunit C